jgi:hypothetical protein
MTKARNLSKIIDGSGNLVVPNAGGNARSLGMVKSDGTPLDTLDRASITATVINTSTPYAGYLSAGIAAGANNALDVDPNYNTTQTYNSGNGAVNQPIDLKKPRNGNWWQWSSYGFSGIPTSNCVNSGSYDGAGGYTESFNPVSVDNIFSGYSTAVDELGGSYQSRTVQNCNCGSFNCRTNCNCNCACACDCACSTDG